MIVVPIPPWMRGMWLWSTYVRRPGRETRWIPEIDYDEIDQIRGLDITITTNGISDVESFALLAAFGMPFSKEGRNPATATQA